MLKQFDVALIQASIAYGASIISTSFTCRSSFSTLSHLFFFSWYFSLYNLFVLQNFVGTFFCYILFVVLDFLSTLLFDILCYFVGFPGIYICPMPASNQDFLIPSFLICNIGYSIFHILFFVMLFYGIFWSSYLFLTACLFFLAYHDFFSFYVSSLSAVLLTISPFKSTFNSAPGISSAVYCYKFHFKVQSQWVSAIINWSYINFQRVQCIKF